MGGLRKISRLINLLMAMFIPHFIRFRLDTEVFSINRFMKFTSKKVESSDIVLDAGAGNCQYKKYFSHAKYESTDIANNGMHDFTCSLNKIPKKKNTYDVIVNTQVLEHVEDPQKVVKEFYRVLKPGGKLFLTTPQSEGLHCEPYHFFNFTKYGLERLFSKAGFRINFIKPRGGIFWYLSKRSRNLPLYVLRQYLTQSKMPVALFLLPFCLMILPVCVFLIPLSFFYLDRLDRHKKYTLGYACYCVKK